MADGDENIGKTAYTSLRDMIRKLEKDNKRLEEHRVLGNKTMTKYLNKKAEELSELKSMHEEDLNQTLKQIKELKESHKLSKEYNTIKRGKIKGVLWELLKEFEGDHDESIHRSFFTGLIQKLGGDKSVSKRENGLNHTHEINEEHTSPTSQPPSCSRKEYCKHWETLCNHAKYAILQCQRSPSGSHFEPKEEQDARELLKIAKKVEKEYKIGSYEKRCKNECLIWDIDHLACNGCDGWKMEEKEPPEFVLSADGYTPNLEGKVIVEKSDLINYKMDLEEINTFIINHAYVQAKLKIAILIVKIEEKYMPGDDKERKLKG